MGKGSNQVVSNFGSIQSNAIALDYEALEIQFLGDVFLAHEDIKLNSDEAYVKVNENTFIAKKSVIFSFGDYKSQSEVEFEALCDSRSRVLIRRPPPAPAAARILLPLPPRLEWAPQLLRLQLRQRLPRPRRRQLVRQHQRRQYPSRTYVPF